MKKLKYISLRVIHVFQVKLIFFTFTFLVCMNSAFISYSQEVAAGYVKYDLRFEKEPTEMATMEKIQARFNHPIEIAWEEDRAIMKKSIPNTGAIFFLIDKTEKNENIYIEDYKTGEKFSVPVGDLYNDMLNKLVPGMREYVWTRTDNSKKIAECPCQVYTYYVKAINRENEWCINEENKIHFTYHPYYQDKSFGLPLSMETGSSIRKYYTSSGIKNTIPEEFRHFDKTSFVKKKQNYLKNKYWKIYNAIVSI